MLDKSGSRPSFDTKFELSLTTLNGVRSPSRSIGDINGNCNSISPGSNSNASSTGGTLQLTGKRQGDIARQGLLADGAVSGVYSFVCAAADERESASRARRLRRGGRC